MNNLQLMFCDVKGHKDNKTQSYFETKWLAGSLEQNLLLLASVLVCRSDGPPLGV